MKVFTQTFDLAKTSPHRFWVTPYSDFKIGIKILAKGEIIDKDFTVKAGAVELIPDEDKIDGFTLYTIKSGDTGFVEYTIEVEDIAEKLKLTQIVTDSTVFEVGAGGGDVPADVATQTWVNQQISSFVEEDALTAYATKDELTAYAETDDLTAYYTKSETSSAIELSGEFSTVSALADSAYNMAEGATISLGSKVDHKAGGTAPEVTNIETYYESEYTQLSVDDPTWEPDENTMYVILPDQV